MLDSDDVAAWEYDLIEQVITSDCAECPLIILNDSKVVALSKFKTYWKNRRTLAYHIFNRIDERWSRCNVDAVKIRNLQEVLSGIPVVRVKPIQKAYSDYFEPDDIGRIKEYGLDILVRIGFRVLRGDIFKVSRYGVWSYHHGDNRINRGGPSAFWEVVEDQPETGVVLQRLSENLDGGQVLYRSWTKTHPFSPARNRRNCYLRSVPFLKRQIELLCRLGEEGFSREIKKFKREFDFYDHRLYRTPSNLLMLWLTIRLFARAGYSVFRDTFYSDQWYLLFDLKGDLSTSFRIFKKVPQPRNRCWSHPHVLHVGGRHYIFFKAHIHKAKKSHISLIEIDEQRNLTGPTQVLERDYPLSYPFVFEWEGNYYMVPESVANKTIELYESLKFPYQWRFKMNLMDHIVASNATLFYYREKWWLFAAIAENEGVSPDNELFLFFSDQLFTSQWEPHPLNPIVSDVKRAKPAGKVFERNGGIFRPSRDCSQKKERGFDLNEILVLSETEYCERAVAHVEPHWDKKVRAVQTFTYEKGLTIIDAMEKTFIFRPPAPKG